MARDKRTEPFEWQKERLCRYCKTPFMPRRHNQAVCGRDKCVAERKAAAQRACKGVVVLEARACSECGEPFLPAQDFHKTCSTKCSQLRQNRMAREGRQRKREEQTKARPPMPTGQMNAHNEYMMADPWPTMDTLPAECRSWHQAEMMPCL